MKFEKTRNVKQYPCILTIAGSDCSGGAGIQADIKTISALGAYAASAITAITVQNTCGVSAICPVPSTYVKGQIQAVMTDISPVSVKIGMINDAGIIRAIAESLHEFTPYYKYIVLDPVMVSTSGCKLMEDNAIEALTSQLMPMATLITPNLSEAEVLTGKRITTIPEMEIAAKELLGFGSQAVLVKGGHLNENEMCDVRNVRCTIYKRRRTPVPFLFSQNREPQYARHWLYSLFCHSHLPRLRRTARRSGTESQNIRLPRHPERKRRTHRRRSRTVEPFLLACCHAGK